MTESDASKRMDSELLEAGFKYYGDWEYGPIKGWSTNYERYSLKLMAHRFGYDVILSCHASGSNPSMNMGYMDSAADIISLYDAISKTK